ncbi:MAG: ATP-binding cassette domain-containing protein [Clostridiales bacterium]|jgi:ribose transport system ATP-binding protein|nr:ATP-binding cassette domain-containing protein [Clostridiales bacterium]
MEFEAIRLHNVTLADESGASMLNNFNLYIYKGEIFGLICINTYGLDALIQLICQNTPIRYGHVYFSEELINSYRKNSRNANAVAVIDKRNRLLEDLNISDNIFVLRPGFKEFLIPEKALDKRVKAIAKELGLSISGRTKASDLTMYERCSIELMRAAASGAKLIILRDISNILGCSELKTFQGSIRRYAASGISFLYISSYCEEAAQICGRAALMENGEILKVMDSEIISLPSLKSFCRESFPHEIGERINTEFGIRESDSCRAKKPASAADMRQSAELPVFEMANVSYGSLKNFSLSVLKGECVLLLDRDNASAPCVEAIMAGLAKRWQGEIFFEGNAKPCKSSKGILDNALVIGVNPTKSMIFANMSYIDNLCFPLERRSKLLWFGRRARRCVQREYEKYLGQDVFADDVSLLSPLSLYNLVYYRACLFKPKVVFCVEPLSEADRFVRRHVISLIETLLGRGISVVMLSCGLRDNLILSDRVFVVENGFKTCEYSRSDFAGLRIGKDL